MSVSLSQIQATDNHPLTLWTWQETKTPPQAVIQIAHGLSEYCHRYRYLAQFLNEHGYVVVGNDHRGHGKTTQNPREIGIFSRKNGWDKAVDDLKTVTQHIQNTYPNLPIILLGHSMGSFLSRDYAARFGENIAGLVLTGTGPSQGVMSVIGRTISNMQEFLCGPTSRARIQNFLSFSLYNRRFTSDKTSQWISRDPQWVHEYDTDPYCGTIPTVSLFRDLIIAVEKVNTPTQASLIPQNLPIWLASGSEDPVGGKNGIPKVASLYLETGHTNIQTTIYPGARHEIFGETNRQEVFHDLLTWLQALPK